MKTSQYFVKLFIFWGRVVVLTALLCACTIIQRTLPAYNTSPTPLAILPMKHTVSFTATLTKEPSPISLPTNTKTITPTRTPKPTFTPTLSPTMTRWVATDVPFVLEAPTPLPTPPVGATAYKLKAWSEEAAFHLVEIAEQYSFADNIPRPFGEKRFDYQADQVPIILAAQEALHRFPEANFKEKLEWRIALANTILDNPASDEWILQRIEEGLNSGEVGPDNLDQMINPFGFVIGQIASTTNLFGDSRVAQVLWITRMDRGYTGLYAALKKDDQGLYTLHKIYSDWNFNFRYDEPFRVEDHTGDDIPEILIHSGYHNGSFCGFDLIIYQWQVDHFADVSKDQFAFNECELVLESWEYGARSENGAETIETWRAVTFYSTVIRYEKYEWNGEWYEVKEDRLLPPEELDLNASQWIVYEMNNEDYEIVAEKVQQFLADEAKLEELEPFVGPSFPDYLRFQLGLTYAFRSNITEARSVFDQIVISPQNPLTTTVSSAAQAFMDNYTGDMGLYKACQAALTVMGKASGIHPFGMDAVDYERLKRTWGYKPDWSWESIALCNLNVAFTKIVSQLDVSQFSQAPKLLKDAGVLIRFAVDADLNKDGQKEWILLVDTPGDDAPVNIWILINTPHEITPIPLVPWTRKQFELPLMDAGTAMLDVKIVTSPEGAVIDFVRAGEHLYTFQLKTGEKLVQRVLWDQTDVESYIVYQKDNGLELEVVVNTHYCHHCKNIYRWYEDSFDAIYPGEPDKKKVIEAEAALLTHWMPDKALPLLINIIQNTHDSTSPRMMYLLGLTYELLGDEVNAVRAYWKLWHDYPDTIYARLAQDKLELLER